MDNRRIINREIRFRIIRDVEKWLGPDSPPLSDNHRDEFMRAVRLLVSQSHHWVEAACAMEEMQR